MATPRTHVDIDGHDFVLTPGQDLDDLMHRIEDAAHTEGTFVRFASDGVLLNALISKTTRVVIAIDSNGGTSDMSEYARSDWEYGN